MPASQLERSTGATAEATSSISATAARQASPTVNTVAPVGWSCATSASAANGRRCGLEPAPVLRHPARDRPEVVARVSGLVAEPAHAAAQRHRGASRARQGGAERQHHADREDDPQAAAQERDDRVERRGRGILGQAGPDDRVEVERAADAQQRGEQHAAAAIARPARSTPRRRSSASATAPARHSSASSGSTQASRSIRSTTPRRLDPRGVADHDLRVVVAAR